MRASKRQAQVIVPRIAERMEKALHTPGAQVCLQVDCRKDYHFVRQVISRLVKNKRAGSLRMERPAKGFGNYRASRRSWATWRAANDATLEVFY